MENDIQKLGNGVILGKYFLDSWTPEKPTTHPGLGEYDASSIGVEPGYGNNAVYDAIVAHLNEKAHTNYKPTTESTRRLINARLAEGHSVEDFMTVIDHKCAEWLGSGMAQYLRPQTLFGTKFEGYLNAPDYTTICYQNRQQNTQEALVERDYSTNMIDLLNEYLGR